MRKNVANLVKLFVRPFMFYITPQSEDSFSANRSHTGTSSSAFNSEIICLLILIFALTSMAIISPVLCFGSLFMSFHIDYLWYFWLITFIEIGYLVWLIFPQK